METEKAKVRASAGPPPVRILEGQAGNAAAARAMRAYLDELADRFDTDVTDPDLVALADAEEVTPPRGDFMLMREIGNADVVGFGAVHVIRPGVVEIKRMWLRPDARGRGDRKSTRLNSSHVAISYAVFCLKKKKKKRQTCGA